MTLAIFFWVIFILWVVLGAVRYAGAPAPYLLWGGDILLVILVGILGYHAFGSMVHG